MDKDKATSEKHLLITKICGIHSITGIGLEQAFEEYAAQKLKEKEAVIALIASELESMITKKYDGPFSNHNVKYDLKVLLEKIKK